MFGKRDMFTLLQFECSDGSQNPKHTWLQEPLGSNLWHTPGSWAGSRSNHLSTTNKPLQCLLGTRPRLHPLNGPGVVLLVCTRVQLLRSYWTNKEESKPGLRSNWLKSAGLIKPQSPSPGPNAASGQMFNWQRQQNVFELVKLQEPFFFLWLYLQINFLNDI